MSELSRRSGVSIPTIKYYIREGLLPPGERTAANQADYGASHVQRLELIRALREVGELSIATIKQALVALEAGVGEHGDVPALVVALDALRTTGAGPASPGADAQRVRDDPDLGRAGERVDDLLRELGWEVPPEAPFRADLARALVAIDRHWPGGVSPSVLLAYGRIVEQLAEVEIPDTWDPGGDSAEALRYAVLGTVLFEAVVLNLRRLAHVDRSRRLAAGRAPRGTG